MTKIPSERQLMKYSRSSLGSPATRWSVKPKAPVGRWIGLCGFGWPGSAVPPGTITGRGNTITGSKIGDVVCGKFQMLASHGKLTAGLLVFDTADTLRTGCWPRPG